MQLNKDQLVHINSIAHAGKIIVVATFSDGSLQYTVRQDGFEQSYRDAKPEQRIGWENWKLLPLPDDVSGRRKWPYRAPIGQAIFGASAPDYVRELLAHRPPGVELWLTTVTTTHPRTLRLKEIQYRVDAVWGTQSRRLFEASIAVSDNRDSPRVTVQATPFGTFS